MSPRQSPPEQPRWTRGQRLLAFGVGAGGLAIITILVASVVSVRSLEASLIASEDDSEQFIAVMREANQVELALERTGRVDAPSVAERWGLLQRHVDVVRFGAGEEDLDPGRTSRIETILTADARLDELLAADGASGDAEAAIAQVAAMEEAAKGAADIAESARRATLLGQVATARTVALGTLAAILTVLAITAALLVSVRRRTRQTHARTWELAVARAAQLEESNRRLEDANSRLEVTNGLLEVTNQQLEEANEQLEQANETKQRFLSMVSHELRTPLTVIRGFGETLATARGDLAGEDQRRLAGAIVRHALRQQRMIDDLLVLARHADHSPATTPDAIAPRDLLEQILRDLPMAGTQVRVSGGPDCAVWADPHHVQQVLENLLTNAAKYGGPHVEVSWSAADDTVSLVVEDDGDGVPEAFVPLMFTPFAQADDGDMRVSRGVGLGLSITQLLVDANDGHIRYRQRPDEGARFEVVLPQAPGTPGQQSMRGQQSARDQRSVAITGSDAAG